MLYNWRVNDTRCSLQPAWKLHVPLKDVDTRKKKRLYFITQGYRFKEKTEKKMIFFLQLSPDNKQTTPNTSNNNTNDDHIMAKRNNNKTKNKKEITA